MKKLVPTQSEKNKMENAFLGEKCASQSTGVNSNDTKKPPASAKSDFKVACGDWRSKMDLQNLTCTENDESYTVDYPSMTLATLPDLPIDFDDQKSVDHFLAKSTPLIKVLLHLRKPIAGYQEVKGVHPNSALTFSALLSTLYANTSAALYTIMMLIYNLMPLLDVGLFVMRFMIDKTIEIVDTEDRYDFYMKTCIFVFQVIFITLLILVMTSIIVFPILSLASHILFRAIHIIT